MRSIDVIGLAVLVVLVASGCGSGDGALDGSVTGMDGAGVDGGPPGCTRDAECDDGVDCTADTCTVGTGVCRHQVVPALCAAGSSCHPTRGCEMGRACGTDVDCEDEDACTVNERCDPAARTCVVDPLDGDADGDPPRVCGGTDCDDSNPEIYAGAVEPCNGLDDDCDGAVDNGADASCGSAASCVGGRCECDSGYTECWRSSDGIPSCADLLTDPENCGGCGDPCGLGPSGSPITCSGGSCDCRTGTTFCPGWGCVSTSSHPGNCGACGNECVDGACAGGACVPCDAEDGPCCAIREPGHTRGSYCSSSGGGARLDCVIRGTGEDCPVERITECACAACGGLDLPCCSFPADAWASDEPCFETWFGVPIRCDEMSGMCTTCGRPGQPCCRDADRVPSIYCFDGVTCMDSRCTCPMGLTECGSVCADTMTSSSNCGACGAACPTGGSCIAGACACPSGWTLCGSECADLTNATRHCGSCGSACSSGQACIDATCTACGLEGESCCPPADPMGRAYCASGFSCDTRSWECVPW